jgi:hypothetical protein
MSGFWGFKRRSLGALALAALLALAPALAEARMGGGGSFGSRGSRSWSAPPYRHHAGDGFAFRAQRHAAARPGHGAAGL